MMEEAAIMKYAAKMEDLRKVYEYIVYLNFFHTFYLITRIVMFFHFSIFSKSIFIGLCFSGYLL